MTLRSQKNCQFILGPMLLWHQYNFIPLDPARHKSITSRFDFFIMNAYMHFNDLYCSCRVNKNYSSFSMSTSLEILLFYYEKIKSFDMMKCIVYLKYVVILYKVFLIYITFVQVLSRSKS